MRAAIKLKKYKPGTCFRPIDFNKCGYCCLADKKIKTYIKENDVCMLLSIESEKFDKYPLHLNPVYIVLYSFLNGVIFRYSDEATNCDFIENFREISGFGE